MRDTDTFLWSQLKCMESEEDATMHPLHIHDSTDLFITLCKHGTVPEKQTCQCVCICVHANIFGVLQCHTWTVFRSSEDRIDISDEFTARWSARGAKQGDLFHSPPHTLFQILAHCVSNWSRSVTIIGIQYVTYCCFNCCIQACICYTIMHVSHFLSSAYCKVLRDCTKSDLLVVRLYINCYLQLANGLN